MSARAAADRAWMEQALALGALGEGTTSPNPRVGCVVVREGEVVGAAFHRAAGEPHAEWLALEQAGPRARGATLYVNLEPCAHHGRTPPCADRIVGSGIVRVVASITDPNPLVNGRGFEHLRAAGIRLETGLLADEARCLNATFLHWHRTRRPWVTLKAAVSIDGLLAAREGRSRWITGPAARSFAHRLRLRHDAVIVGAGTIRSDDPSLTVRLEGTAVKRLRVVLSASLRLDPSARVFRSEPGGPPTRLYAPEDGPRPDRALERRVELRRVPASGDGLELGAVLEDLGRDGVQSVLVEGGGRTLASFLRSGAAEGLAVFAAPLLLGARGGTPMLDGASAEEPGVAWRLASATWIPLAGDTLVLGGIVRGGARAGRT